LHGCQPWPTPSATFSSPASARGALTDPDVPPLPPHISFEQARSFASAAIKENVAALGYLKQTVKEVAASVLPRTKK
jgi:pyruvate dehydrogenase (quinone)